jgi:hypothetical protein
MHFTTGKPGGTSSTEVLPAIRPFWRTMPGMHHLLCELQMQLRPCTKEAQKSQRSATSRVIFRQRRNHPTYLFIKYESVLVVLGLIHPVCQGALLFVLGNISEHRQFWSEERLR